MLAEFHSSALRQLLQTTACSIGGITTRGCSPRYKSLPSSTRLGLSEGRASAPCNGRYAPWPRGFTGYQLQQSIENALQHRRPAAVFIDEAQHLGRIASGRKLADQLDVIKSTASRSHTVHVLIGTYELLAFRNLSAQLSRRSVDLHFSRYRTESTEDIEIFQNAVFTFQKQLRSCERLGFSQHMGLPLRAIVRLHRHLKRLAHAGVGRSCPKRLLLR